MKKHRKFYHLVDYSYLENSIIITHYYGSFTNLCKQLKGRYGDLNQYGNIKALCVALTKQIDGHAFAYDYQ